jgi:multidrug efflux pump subunit AcrB
VRDIARVELAARDYTVNSGLGGKPATAIAIFQLPGSNALATSDAVRKKMAELKQRFPTGLDYTIVYDPTVSVRESIHEVQKTLFEAIALVVLVVLIFLQTWRAAIIPPCHSGFANRYVRGDAGLRILDQQRLALWHRPRDRHRGR